MTHVERVEVTLVLSDGTMVRRAVVQPGPSGDNPRFLQAQFDPAIEKAAHELRQVIRAVYGDQHDPNGPARPELVPAGTVRQCARCNTRIVFVHSPEGLRWRSDDARRSTECAGLGLPHTPGGTECDCNSLGACFPTCASRVPGLSGFTREEWLEIQRRDEQNLLEGYFRNVDVQVVCDAVVARVAPELTLKATDPQVGGDYTVGVPVHECIECGALVRSPGQHARWHREQS